MATVDWTSRTFGGLLSLMLCAAAVTLAGCDDESTDGTGGLGGATVVSLVGTDINKDGTISEAGMKKIEANAAAPNLTVSFLRTPLSDAGLNQLAKFPNVRKVEAYNSRITPAGIEKFKRARPEAEVQR